MYLVLSVFIGVHRRPIVVFHSFPVGVPLADALGDPIGNQQKWLVAEHLLIAVLRAGTGDRQDGEEFA
jgi:hypothetical protein